MAAIERRAKKTKPEAEAPISHESRDPRDTWPAPPMSATIASTTIASGSMASGSMAVGSVAVHDTIPTPPPSPNDEVEEVEIPTLRGLDLERSVAELGENEEDTKARSED